MIISSAVWFSNSSSLRDYISIYSFKCLTPIVLGFLLGFADCFSVSMRSLILPLPDSLSLTLLQCFCKAFLAPLQAHPQTYTNHFLQLRAERFSMGKPRANERSSKARAEQSVLQHPFTSPSPHSFFLSGYFLASFFLTQFPLNISRSLHLHFSSFLIHLSLSLSFFLSAPDPFLYFLFFSLVSCSHTVPSVSLFLSSPSPLISHSFFFCLRRFLSLFLTYVSPNISPSLSIIPISLHFSS